MKFNWKEITIEVVSEQLGPVGVVIVNDVIDSLDLANKPITPAIYSQFLIKLSSNLPGDINPIELCRKCRELILNTNTTNKTVTTNKTSTMNSNWKKITIEVVSEDLGPAGIIIVNDVIDSLNLKNKLITPTLYSQFLMKLSSELPGNVNSIDICRKCRQLVM